MKTASAIASGPPSTASQSTVGTVRNPRAASVEDVRDAPATRPAANDAAPVNSKRAYAGKRTSAAIVATAASGLRLCSVVGSVSGDVPSGLNRVTTLANTPAHAT